MNLETYQQLSGITVPDNEVTLVTAQIQRAKKILEGMLGYTLSSKQVQKNFYNERGKSPTECSCPDVDSEDLLDPDQVQNAYRLFDYNAKDKYLHIDPFTEVYSVKLVWNDVTVKTFDADEFRANYGKNGWGKFVENCQRTLCSCACDCLQLAVDAQWLDVCKYDELMYIWTDMVTYYADCKKDVKQESIGSHSYTKFDRDIRPEDEHSNLAVLRKYAGQHGTLTKVIVT